ncbi:class I SAM-dependent methyltransferase [Iningainema tapete]|uniref:Class I SAM-dependent methyltransferase n=1 Tax=Iningainema tapete BLCC-T55 TaxID=2748662 RepID=A0A8J6XEQ5_9CYAN|nr:class I SAM-dependent methyltransferase [Iningainema tapete]MBD2772388.1 class I SAM-dependent methyltransferase [Iningainema tapete BLCC-T55]
MRNDPFAIKQYPKWHPIRLAFTAKARILETEAKRNFQKYELPEKIIPHLPPVPEVDFTNTAVTPVQIQHLLYALSLTEHLTDTVVVEIGCYRGVTTQILAASTNRKVIAVDPYIGYGGSEEDYRHFQKNTCELPNVIHERKTSGEAAKTWKYNPASLVFIDAVHDYVNTSFDIDTWSSLMVKGGVLACHDTDQDCFAGTRKAVFEFSYFADQFAHPNNLTLLSLKG